MTDDINFISIGICFWDLFKSVNSLRLTHFFSIMLGHDMGFYFADDSCCSPLDTVLLFGKPVLCYYVVMYYVVC